MVLGLGSTIAPDAHAAALGLAACYTFWRWLKHPTWMQTILTGVVLGLAELSKTTFILFYPIWPLIWIVYRLGEQRARKQRTSQRGAEGEPEVVRTRSAGPPRVSSLGRASRPSQREGEMTARQWAREAGMLAVRMLIGIYVLNLGYLGEGSFTRLGEFRFVSELFGGEDVQIGVGGNRFADTPLASVPVPFPKNYILGIDIQQRDFENFGRPSYLRGEWRETGWWYYYLYAVLVKTPLGTLGLMLLSVLVCFTRFAPPIRWYDAMVLLVPPAVIFAVASYKCGFSHHSRYIMPCVPFVFVWLGQFGIWMERAWCSTKRRVGPVEPSAAGTNCNLQNKNRKSPVGWRRPRHCLANRFAAKKGSDPNCAKHPSGRSGNWGPTPFSRSVICETVPRAFCSVQFSIFSFQSVAKLARWLPFVRFGEPSRESVRGGAALGLVSASLLAWTIASSLSVYPHSLSYFNELAGGPKNGPAHLLNSNIDWGQDLLFLEKWAQENAAGKPVYTAFYNLYNPFDLEIAGIEPWPFARKDEVWDVGPVVSGAVPVDHTDRQVASDRPVASGLLDGDARRSGDRSTYDDGDGRRSGDRSTYDDGEARRSGAGSTYHDDGELRSGDRSSYVAEGYYAISVNLLYDYPWGVYDRDGQRYYIDRRPHGYLRSIEPVGWAGYSIRIFSADQLRAAFAAEPTPPLWDDRKAWR